LGPDWRVVPDTSSEVYLHRADHAGPWRIVGAVHRAAGPSRATEGGTWRAEYHDFENGLPRTIRLTSVDSDHFDLRLTLSQDELNVPLGAEAFTVRIPPNTEPITLQELKETGPLGTTRAAGGAASR